MRKRLLWMMLTSVLLVGCTNNSKSYSSTSTSVSTESSMSSSERSSIVIRGDEPASKLTEVDVEFENWEGYKIKAHIRLGQWIKGSELEKLNKDLSYFEGKSDFTVLELPLAQTGSYLFGEMSFENLSIDFPASQIRVFSVGLRVSNFDKEGNSVSDAESVKISNALTFYSQPKLGLDKMSNGFGITPKFNKDTWGPVTFITTVANAYSPKYPDGKQSIKNAIMNVYIPSVHKVTKAIVNGVEVEVSPNNSFNVELAQ